jgi:hypothetical protein
MSKNGFPDDKTCFFNVDINFLKYNLSLFRIYYKNIFQKTNLIKKQNLIRLKLGIGDWGLGIGDWGLGPIPNPQSPIPNPHFNHYY